LSLTKLPILRVSFTIQITVKNISKFMNLKFVVSHVTCTQPLIVELAIATAGHQQLLKKNINLQDNKPTIDVDIKDFEFNDHDLYVSFTTTDFNIINVPLTIDQTILDNFYSMKKLVYAGVRKFDQPFLDYADNKKMYLDPTVTDDNCLQFTGSLVYSFKWPFFKNIFVQ
jgi:hypothetical protein